MFEIWQTDKDQKKHKLLASTPFVDMAEVCALGIANRLWNLDSSYVMQQITETGASYLTIYKDDQVYAKISAQPTHKLAWKVVEQ